MSAKKSSNQINVMKPCPKCGCPDRLVVDSIWAEASWIECGNCEYRVQQKCDEETLIERWNKRSRKKMPMYAKEPK